jgi:hypothetical protein
LHTEYSNNCEWQANYFIVLCELKWSYEIETAPLSGLNGIKIGQWLRIEKKHNYRTKI